MFKNEEYSSFLNIFTKIKFKILLIYKFYIPISTFRVSYKATTINEYLKMLGEFAYVAARCMLVKMTFNQHALRLRQD